MGSRLGRVDPIFRALFDWSPHLGSTDGEGTCMKTVALSRRSTKVQCTSLLVNSEPGPGGVAGKDDSSHPSRDSTGRCRMATHKN